MKNKEKILSLVEKYFEGDTTPGEELRLRRYIVRSSDPDFDGVRAVMGYYSIGRRKKTVRPELVRLAAACALAACLVLAIVLPPSENHSARRAETILAAFFSEGADVEDSLYELLNPENK